MSASFICNNIVTSAHYKVGIIGSRYVRHDITIPARVDSGLSTCDYSALRCDYTTVQLYRDKGSFLINR